MNPLLWYANARGELERVPVGFARGVVPVVPDHTCEVEFRPGADDAPYEWRAPSYPKSREES